MCFDLIRSAFFEKRLSSVFIGGPLHDPVTWLGINYAWTQMTLCDFENKGKSGWTGTSSFVLKVPLRFNRGQTQEHVQCTRTRSPAAKIPGPKFN